MKYKSVKGMEDILPRDIGAWQELERRARKELEFYGYKEIRTPILEDTALFARSIGETADIVTKEMFTFKDRKGRTLTLRPEGTAPIARAYIEHSLDKISPVAKLYYIGHMFRSERPQKGRSRQFYQIGAEIFGTDSPFADAEAIMGANNLLKALGLKGFIIKLNSLGCKKDKGAFAGKLKKYLEDKRSRLCADCKDRLKRNVLRALDCKNESCAEVVRGGPDILDSLCGPCKNHYDRLKNCLLAMKISFEETKNLVRGLDYYTGTVFEITHPSLGAQDAIGAGGRYDNLVRDFGGPDTGAVGYALGVERTIIALKEGFTGSKNPDVIYIATLGEEAKIKGFQLTEKIKEKLSDRIIVLTDAREGSLKAQMRYADRAGAKIVIILGENEIKENKATLREMSAKRQTEVPNDKITKEIAKRINVTHTHLRRTE